MSLVKSGISILRPALILYAMKAVMAMVIILPTMSYLNGKFGFSRLADDFWPVPEGIALVELFWQVRELIYFILPLLFIVSLIYFLIMQFLYGGICACALGDGNSSSEGFFKAGIRYFGGFIKIALAAIPVYLLVFLIADLIGIFIGKLFGLIIGDTGGSIITASVVFLFLYCLNGYVINLRLAQIKNDNSSLRFAIKFTRQVMATRLKHFLALNMMVGIVTIIVLALTFLIMIFISRLDFSMVALIMIFVMQQLIVFMGSFFEVF
ncbi:MAG: hypothetical protein GY839_13965 [candidate division Zixibacteria bacterium]|nr:hypothetical protein [candidate division Zixibacteria bacterium]